MHLERTWNLSFRSNLLFYVFPSFNSQTVSKDLSHNEKLEAFMWKLRISPLTLDQSSLSQPN